ncbi:polyprenyl synthetase family protein [Actinomadura craniellae]|uniref:Polyprenyl synthetase family protein n=1 Tax=Actinomadura craniellae TaxID=2231787 RepID=A0A365HDJ2_9ACTN|nr:family 2 encapsulin nanocompartment cargo protein polyprenyl transferase [Actinomadura craniellae]RAY17171.1 polyprenyl synthetase family protein [Actinomadura craniellae]
MTAAEQTAEDRPVTEVLAWSRSLLDPALREAVETLPASIRSIADYHFGWRDEQGRPVEGGAGKAIRPALVLLAAEAVGGDPAEAVPAAVAVELAHNFSLMHDDVMDGDTVRRHRPTAWNVFGVNSAILAGDALLMLAFDVLAASGHPLLGEGMRRLGAAVAELLDGQRADMGFERRADVGLEECLRMAEAKTGALLGCSSALGGAFGGGAPDQVKRLDGFGRRLGLAFQMVDDLLGVWGDPAVTGKPGHSDLRNGKKSLPVVAALTSGTPAGEELAAFYRAGGPPAGADLDRVAGLIVQAGGRSWCRTRADELLSDALRELWLARPGQRPAAELGMLARHSVRRDH